MNTLHLKLRTWRAGLTAFATAVALSSHSLPAAQITITNGSFENPVLADGGSVVNNAPGWTGTGTFQIQNLIDSFFSGTSDSSPGPNPIDGKNAVGINSPGKVTYQAPNLTVQSNTIYSLTFRAGRRIGNAPFGSSSVSFWAGTNRLAEVFPTPTESNFLASSLNFTSAFVGLIIGQPMRFELTAAGADAQPWFDDFKLNTTIAGPCTPRRAQAAAQIVNGFVVGAMMVDNGCGYTNPPTVLIKGGGGTGATATALITNGQVAAIQIANPGCCYTNVPVIEIASPPFVPVVSIRYSRVMVVQSVVLGRNYVLESSSNLVHWASTGPAFTATSEQVETEFEITPAQQYFRLQEVP
jgi:hypothetical protein